MIKIETVDTGNFSMEYFKFGRGDRILVVIPGVSIQSVMKSADDVANAFVLAHEDFTTYVFDRRKDLPSEYNVYDMARDTTEVIKQLGLTDIYLFGASQGGMISMTIAIENPELVKKLALASTSSHVNDEQFGSLEKWIELAKKGDREGLYLKFGEMIYPKDIFEQFRGFLIDASKTVTDDELKRFIIIAQGAKDFNVTERLKEIKCPVLTTGTFEDQVLDSDATMEIAQELDYNKYFQLYMYTGFGHASFDTAPDFRKRVLDFYLK